MDSAVRVLSRVYMKGFMSVVESYVRNDDLEGIKLALQVMEDREIALHPRYVSGWMGWVEGERRVLLGKVGGGGLGMFRCCRDHFLCLDSFLRFV